jgi:CheY-like chemotaxis protein
MAPDTLDRRDFAGLRILVVEDVFLIADVIVEQLRDFGCEVVGPAARVRKALALVRQERLDGALLDLNLAGEYCFPVASSLIERGVPFAFLTGYGDLAVPENFRNIPRLVKPFTVSDLERLLSAHFVQR